MQVNGTTVTELGTRARRARRDHIRVDGKLLHGKEQQRYYMLNKPRGYVTTLERSAETPDRDAVDDCRSPDRTATRCASTPLGGWIT